MGAQCAYHRLDHYLLDICSYPSPKPCIVMWQVQATINCLWNVCVCVYAKSLQLCLILCDPMDCIACQAPLSVEFSRQDYWSRLPRSPLGDIPNSGVEPRRQLLCLLHWQLGSLPLAPPGKPQVLFQSLKSLNILKENSAGALLVHLERILKKVSVGGEHTDRMQQV